MVDKSIIDRVKLENDDKCIDNKAAASEGNGKAKPAMWAAVTRPKSEAGEQVVEGVRIARHGSARMYRQTHRDTKLSKLRLALAYDNRSRLDMDADRKGGVKDARSDADEMLSARGLDSDRSEAPASTPEDVVDSSEIWPNDGTRKDIADYIDKNADKIMDDDDISVMTETVQNTVEFNSTVNKIEKPRWGIYTPKSAPTNQKATKSPKPHDNQGRRNSGVSTPWENTILSTNGVAKSQIGNRTKDKVLVLKRTFSQMESQKATSQRALRRHHHRNHENKTYTNIGNTPKPTTFNDSFKSGPQDAYNVDSFRATNREAWQTNGKNKLTVNAFIPTDKMSFSCGYSSIIKFAANQDDQENPSLRIGRPGTMTLYHIGHSNKGATLEEVQTDFANLKLPGAKLGPQSPLCVQANAILEPRPPDGSKPRTHPGAPRSILKACPDKKKLNSAQARKVRFAFPTSQAGAYEIGVRVPETPPMPSSLSKSNMPSLRGLPLSQ